jgi:hypothetical protein
MYVYPCNDKTIGIIWKQEFFEQFKRCYKCSRVGHCEKDFYNWGSRSDYQGCKFCRKAVVTLKSKGILPKGRHSVNDRKRQTYPNEYLLLIVEYNESKKMRKDYTASLKDKIKKRLKSEYGVFKCTNCNIKVYKKDLPVGLKSVHKYSRCHNCYLEMSREHVRKSISNKYKTNPKFRFEMSIRSLIIQSLNRSGYKKNSRTHEILGCDFQTFKTHIEKQFLKGMTWENRGEWHLDHIYPVSKARDEKHLIELNHYTNFRPLWAFDNISKNNKIIEHQLKMPI